VAARSCTKPGGLGSAAAAAAAAKLDESYLGLALRSTADPIIQYNEHDNEQHETSKKASHRTSTKQTALNVRTHRI
jgi:hypothetical protein